MSPFIQRTDQIITPTLLLDEEQARRNIAAMARRAAEQGVIFRPHFKTHQAAAVGEWFRDYDVTAITVSSVSMARYFAQSGWRDITIAFPVNLRELAEIDALAAEVRLGLLLDASAVADRLAAELTHPVDVWIEIDTEYRRSGALWSDKEWLADVAVRCEAAPQLSLRGVLCHAGNTYGARSLGAVRQIHATTMARMTASRSATAAATRRDDLQISIGDTPACALLDDLGSVDEMRPGNFVFYDLVQEQIGACRMGEIAVAVACPVVGVYPRRRELALYGGAVHLSKDALTLDSGQPSFGCIAPLTESGWGEPFPGAYLRSVSQEHGVVSVAEEAWPGVCASLAVGDLVAVLPVHSCLTANLLKRYLTLDGQNIEMAAIPR